MEIIKNPNYDFLGKAKYFVALSLALHPRRRRRDGCTGTSATASSSPAARSSSCTSRARPRSTGSAPRSTRCRRAP